MKIQQSAGWLSGLVSLAAAQTATPSNNKTGSDSGNNDIKLLFSSQGNFVFPYNVFPLTDGAYNRLPHANSDHTGLNGTVLLNTPGADDSVSSLPPYGIAYTSCNSSDYADLSMQDSISLAIRDNATAILFYATGANFCNISDLGAYSGYANLYSMTSSNDSIDLYSRITGDMAVNHARLFSEIAYNNFAASMHDSILGGSGSTAIAMIILYAITGIITCLFLIIIITGAVRAHRHPERYGPRNVLGIPRQSRAKGIARAMLETIPIVKFGEQNNGVKDVEGSATENTAGSHEMTNQAGNGETQVNATSSEETAPSGILPAISTNVPAATDGARTPIPDSAAALNPNAVTSPSAHDDSETQTCSICTDDFALGQDIRLLPCNHAFHPACVDPWLLDVSGTCPLCRVDLRPAEDGVEGSGEDGTLPPPLDPEAAERENAGRRDGGRRRTVMSFFSNIHAGREERIAALRRWNETNGARNSTNAAVAPGTEAAPVGVAAETAAAQEEDTRRRSRLGGLSRLIKRGRGQG